jgi:hypothetical protein
MNAKYKNLYQEIVSRDMTDLDEDLFYNEYSTNDEKFANLYSYALDNNLTSLDPKTFQSEYFGVNTVEKKNPDVTELPSEDGLSERFTDQTTKDPVRDSWNRPESDKWFGFNEELKQFTEGKNKGKDFAFRSPGDNWWGYSEKQHKTIATPIKDHTKKNTSEIYTNFPGKGNKEYEFKVSDGVAHWYEANPKKASALAELNAAKNATRPGPMGHGTMPVYSPEQIKKKEAEYKKIAEKIIIEDDARVRALNNHFKKNASLDPIDQVYTNYDEEKKDNEYRINDGNWQRKVPGATSWTTVTDEGAISGLNRRYSKEVKYKPELKFVKQEPKLEFAGINTSLVSKTEEDAVTILSKNYGKYGFTFEQTGYGTDYIIAYNKDKTKQITVGFDEANPEEALKLKSFLEQNASKEKSNAALELEKKIKSLNSTHTSPSAKGYDILDRTNTLKYVLSDEYKTKFSSLSFDEMEDQINNYIKTSFQKSEDLDKFWGSDAYKIFKEKKKEEFGARDERIDLLYTELQSAKLPADIKKIKSKITAYLTEDVIQDQVKNYSIQLNDLDKSAKILASDQKKYLQSVDDFNKLSQSGQMTQEEFDLAKKNLEDQAEKLGTRADFLMSSGKSIQNDQKKLNVVAGKYFTKKEKAGSFGGGIVNSILTGISKSIIEVPSTFVISLTESSGSEYFKLSPEEKQYYKDKGYSKDQTINLLLNNKIKDFKAETRKNLIDVLGSDQTTQEYMKSGDRGVFAKAIFGVAESAPAMLMGFGGYGASFVALSTQAFSSIEDEMFSDPDFETSSAGERALVAVPYAIFMGVLENFGLKNIVKGSSFTGGIIKDILIDSIKQMPKDATKGVLQNIMTKEVKSALAKGTFKIVNGAIAEFETGATQSLVLDIGLKALYNEISQSGMTEEQVSNLSGGEMFATPDTLGELNSTVLEDGLAEAIGGATVSTFTTVASGLKNGNISLYNEDDLNYLKEISQDSEFKKLIVANLKTEMLKGNLTKSEAQERLDAMNELSSVIQSIPGGLSNKDQISAVNTLSEKNRLTKEIQGKDPALVTAQTDRINEINEELKNISKNATKEDNIVQQEGSISEYQGTNIVQENNPRKPGYKNTIVKKEESTTKSGVTEYKTYAVDENGNEKLMHSGGIRTTVGELAAASQNSSLFYAEDENGDLTILKLDPNTEVLIQRTSEGNDSRGNYEQRTSVRLIDGVFEHGAFISDFLTTKDIFSTPIYKTNTTTTNEKVPEVSSKTQTDSTVASKVQQEVNSNDRTSWSKYGKEYKVGDIIDGNKLDELSGDLVGNFPNEKFILVQEPLSKFTDTREKLLSIEEGYEKEEIDRLESMKSNFDKTPPIPNDGDGMHRIISAKELGHSTILMWKNIKDVNNKDQVAIDKPVITTNTTAEVERVKSLSFEAEDGATFNIDGTKYEGVGLVVPVDSMNTTTEELTPEMVADFVAERQEMIGDAGVVKAGIYKFPNSNQVSIDLSVVVPETSREQALEFARLAGQESLFDLETFENIKTGATGQNPMKFTSEQHREISKALKEGRIPNVFGATAETTNNLLTKENVKEFASKQKTTAHKLIVKAAKMVLNAIPGVKIYMHNNGQEMASAIEVSKKQLTKEEKTGLKESSGLYVDGDIHINLESATIGTVYHEAFHALIEKNGIKSGSILLMAKGLKNIISDKGIKQRLDDFVSQYNEDEKAEEYISELGGILSEAEQELTTTKLQQFKTLINNIAKKLGLPVIFSASATAQDAADFINTMSKKLRTGKEIKDLSAEGKDGKIKRQVEKLFLGETPKFKSLDDVSKYIQSWVNENKLFDKSIEEVSDQVVIDKFSEHVLNEIRAWESIKGSEYVGFYNEDIPQRLNPELQKFAKQRYGRELTGEEVSLYHMVSAFASPSADPHFDSSKGLEVFDKYMMTGNLSAYGTEQATIWDTDSKGKRYDTGKLKFDDKGNPVYKQVAKAYATTSLEKFNNIVNNFNGDVSKAVNWVLSNHSFDDASKMMGKPTTGAKANQLDENEYFTKENGGTGVFAITGAKLGSYILNRIGNYSTVTKDMWYARTLARLAGESLTEKGKAIKSPWASNTKQGLRKRKLADKAFEIVAKELGTSPADVQQKIWDFEKRLYEKLGAVEKTSYASEGLKSKAKQILSQQPSKIKFQKNLPQSVEKRLTEETSSKIKKQLIGKNANLSQNVRDNLQVARDMENAKKDAKTIRIATGWERGADKKWRYEVPDIKFKKEFEGEFLFPIDKLKRIPSGMYVAKLSDLFDAKSLFESYNTKLQKELPVYEEDGTIVEGGILYNNFKKLEDITVYFEKGGYAEGEYDPIYNNITIFFKPGNSTNEEILVTIAHEIQHYIQDREGFAFGTSPENPSIEAMSVISKLNKLKKEIIEKTKDDSIEDLKSGLIKEIENSSFSKTRDYINWEGSRKSLFIEFLKDENYDGKIFKGGLNKTFSEYLKMQNQIKSVGYYNYRRYAGEVESRNVEKRIKMTPEERRQTTLQETEDVSREDQIIFFEEGAPSKIKKQLTQNWVATPVKSMKDSPIAKNSDNLRSVAIDLAKGKINQGEYADAVKKYSPIGSIGTLFAPSTLSHMIKALGKKAGKLMAPVVDELGKKIKRVGLRLDIPSYLHNNAWIVTVHDGRVKNGNVISYRNAARLKNVDFTTDPRVALNIAAGFNSKGTFARMEGEMVDIPGETAEEQGLNAQAMVEEIMNDPSWVQVGMNPFRHSFFWNRANGAPVVSADEVIQVGGLVYAKNVIEASPNSDRFTVYGKYNEATNKVVASDEPLLDKSGSKIKFQKTRQETRMDNEAEAIFKKSLDRGVAWNTAIQNVIDYIQISKWYEEASDIDREQKIRNFRQSKKQKLKKAPSVDKILGTPKPSMVTVKEKTALKDQIKLEARAAREAKVDLNQKRKLLSTAIKGLVKLGKLTTRQAGIIIERVGYVNLDDQVMVNRLADYAARVFEKADYQERLSRAFSFKKGIRKLLKGDIQAEVVGMAKKFSKIDPSMVDDIEKYLEMAEIVKNAIKPSRINRKDGDVKMRESMNIDSVSEFTNDAIENQEAILKEELLAVHSELVDAGVIDDKMSLSEIESTISSLKEKEDGADYEGDILTFLSNRIDTMSEIIKDILTYKINPMTGEDVALTEKNIDLISRMLNIDINNVSIKETIFIAEAMDNFINNNITSSVEAVIEKHEGATELENLIADKVVASPLRKYFSNKIGQYMSEQIASMPILFEKLFVGAKNALMVAKKMGWTALINGVNKAEKMFNTTVDVYFKQYSKTKPNGKSFNDAENVYERGMIAFLSRNVSGTVTQQAEELKRNQQLSPLIED